MRAVPVANAPAKVNWTLDILGRRSDGYHDVATVMSTIGLFDDLVLLPADEWRVTVDAPEPLRTELETADNLVRRAAAALAAAAAAARDLIPPAAALWPPHPALGPPARIHLTKRIPAAAGLGGGSSDAAAALRLLAEHWRLVEVWGVDTLAARLERIAGGIGSDVAFFIRGGTQLGRGRGELLTPLHDPEPVSLVLLSPPLAVERKTARMYGALTARDYTDGACTAALANRLCGVRIRIDERDLCNAFEAAAPAVFPGIMTYCERLQAAVGAPAHLCGAGPSLYALAADEQSAQAAAARLRDQGLAAWAVTAPA
jgi:4-diphosphocytidyl-2-C-methyl-D-erythritol kinase